MFDSHNAGQPTGSRQPEPFDLQRVHTLVAGTRFERIRYEQVTGSTNDDAVALLGAPGSTGLVLLADYQRAGKGRRSRSWIAPPKSSLLFTTILPEPIAAASLWAVPFWCALAVAEAIAQCGNLAVELQWPNDLLLKGRKCCGILAVTRVLGEHAWVGCGVGLNVRRPPDSAPLAAIEPAPAFLCDQSPTIEREPLLAAILRVYDTNLAMLTEPMRVARTWETRANLRGTRYHIAMDGNETLEGEAQRLDDDGSLIVQTLHAQRRVTLGDARVLRES